jgi:hypothetical protein
MAGGDLGLGHVRKTRAVPLENMSSPLKSLDTEAKSCAEGNQIILTDLSNMDADQWSWFEKKRAKNRQWDV